MKVVAILGSPRANANSATIAYRFLESAKALGADTQTFELNTLAFRGCQACRACKKHSDICVLKDDLVPVLDAARHADILLLATPVYFGDVTAQMKLFVDRTYSFLVPDFHSNPNPSRLAPGKIGVLIQTQGLAESMFADVFPRYDWYMKFIGIAETHLIRGCGLAKTDDILKHEDILAQAQQLAEQLVTRSQSD